MADQILIMDVLPAFPLQILPIPGELMPLHIFEPRYRQLLTDAEENDIEFVTYPTSEVNPKSVGSILKLEQVIRRFPTGESDIIVRSIDLCRVVHSRPFFKDKLYPGASVEREQADLQRMAGLALVLEFSDCQRQLKKTHHGGVISQFHIAGSLQLDLNERIRFAQMSNERRETFLRNQIRYELKLIEATEKSKKTFHLN